MTMTFAVANMRVARDVREAERALDEALLRQSELFASMVTARRKDGRSSARRGLTQALKGTGRGISIADGLRDVHRGRDPGLAPWRRA